jgi:hypothetical protein
MQAQTITYVRSSRDATKFYTVAENARGFLECDCPAATFYRSRPCKHIEQVGRGCGLAATPVAAPTPAGVPFGLSYAEPRP